MPTVCYKVSQIVAIWIFCFSLWAEEIVHASSLEEAKSHYILETIKHITWPNEQELTHFSIIILGNDKALIRALSDVTKNKKIRAKNIIINVVSNQTQLTTLYKPNSMLVLTKENKSSIKIINQKYSDALIINDGKVYRDDLMISLVTYTDHGKRQIKLMLNRKNIVSRGYQVSINLLDFAGTKEDLSQQLEENSRFLQSLLQDVKDKESQLTALERSLKDNRNALKLAVVALKDKNTLLNKNKEELNALQQLRNSARNELSESQHQLALQKLSIARKQQALTAQSTKLARLRQQITDSQNRLQDLEDEFIRQQRVMKRKEKTINEQQSLLTLTTVVIFSILLLSYFVLRLAKMRKKANKDLKNLNSQLYELATTDSMTKLLNRRHFLELAQLHLAELQRSKLNSALLMIDIDHFKKVNDTYGHAMGDEAIIAFANLLKASLREYDIVGRIGGEEFAMLLSHCETSAAEAIAERLRYKTNYLAISLKNIKITISISIGLKLLTSDDHDIGAAMQKADKALYQAKTNGRNQVIVYHGKKTQ